MTGTEYKKNNGPSPGHPISTMGLPEGEDEYRREDIMSKTAQANFQN